MNAKTLFGVIASFALVLSIACDGGGGGTGGGGRHGTGGGGDHASGGGNTSGGGGGSEQAGQAVDPAQTGTVSGVVSFEGSPINDEIQLDNEYCVEHNGNASIPDPACRVVDGHVPNCMVWVDGLNAFRFDVPTAPTVLDQHNCAYGPLVVGVMRGQTLEVLNSDGTNHNVHGRPARNPEFNISQSNQGQRNPVENLTVPEEHFRIDCDVHGWMHAHGFVFRHPKFAVTGNDGAFTIAGVPAGHYTVRVWHAKYGEGTAEVDVTAGGAATANFTLRH